MRRRPILRYLVLACALALTACGSILTEGTADVAGVAAAGAATSVTRSAAGAAAVGLVVQSLAEEGLKHVERRVHRTEQELIAQAAGPLPDGAVAAWSVDHSLPIEADEAGQVVVARSFGVATFRCKDIVFSVDTKAQNTKAQDTTDGAGPRRAFYTATICQDGRAWHWASAEPATERWGALQ